MGAQETTEAAPLAPPYGVKEMTAAEVAPVEEILGYRFSNRSLASAALTHPSFYPRCCYIECPTYDRLEFVGDAVLNLLMAQEVFTAYPHLQSGSLTRLRAVNVDTEKFARIAVNHGIHSHLRHKTPLLEDQFGQITSHQSSCLLDSLCINASISNSHQPLICQLHLEHDCHTTGSFSSRASIFFIMGAWIPPQGGTSC